MISYRRSDSNAASNRLADTLRASHEVFIDSHLQAGDQWREVIIEQVRAAHVVLAVIGDTWAENTIERSRRKEEDVLRVEIETALRDGIPIIPVLIDDAKMPPERHVARPFRPLLGRQCAKLGSGASYHDDVAGLVRRMEQLRSAPRLRLDGSTTAETSPREGQDPYIRGLAASLAAGKLITVLGPQSNDGPELAAQLAKTFGLSLDVANLAWVSQQVFMGQGRMPLYESLRTEALAVKPSAVHDFLAGLPRRLRASGRNDAQLIITTNYDSALERAFDHMYEPYDVALFLAKGPNRGRFVHIPWWDPEHPNGSVISEPDEYTRFPFDDVLNIDRTIILKLYGGTAEPHPADQDLDENFVATEDDYIGYLAQLPLNKIVPSQLLSKIRRSHFLFLGYPLQEWHVRVFLQRFWDGQPLGSRSTVVTPAVDTVVRQRWGELSVDVVEEALPSFTSRLAAELGGLAPAVAAQ
jgi:hypothetical protein